MSAEDLDDPDRFETIGWAYGLPECAVAISALCAADIPVHSSARHLASVASHWMVALGGIDLRVPAGLVCEARVILSTSEVPLERRSHLLRKLGLAFLFLVTAVPPPAHGLFLRTAAGPCLVQPKPR